VNDFSHLFGFQQLLQCVAVEQGGSLISELGEFQFEAVDLSRLSEDLTDADVPSATSLDDLVPEGIQDALKARTAVENGAQ